MTKIQISEVFTNGKLPMMQMRLVMLLRLFLGTCRMNGFSYAKAEMIHVDALPAGRRFV